MTILDRILEAKRAEVAELDAGALTAALAEAPPPRSLGAALRSAAPPAIIAEFKRASPSVGEIRPGADPADIAAIYEANGAVALSVLTDAEFFSGSLHDLTATRLATQLPVLRKDFTIDPLQVTEARAAGADAVLLIVAALADDQLTELLAEVSHLGMEAVVEVHNEAEAERARQAGADLVGVNNRDLRTFETNPGVTKRLLPELHGCTVISESGLGDPSVVGELAAAGVTAFLVGEALMRAEDPGSELKRLRGES